MSKITFYPLGNADSALLEISDGTKEGRLVLMDYGNENNDKSIDLDPELRAKLKGRSYFGFDAVAFSHLDRDHICGASEFFYLEHAKEYQSSDRPRIAEMWVPAAVLTEDVPEDDKEERIIQKEARHRFREKTGIRVFSGPNRLDEWMKKAGVSWEGRRGLVTNAGELIPGFDDKHSDGAEFFVHSPFAHVQNKCAKVDRNDDCLVFQVTFHTPGQLVGGGRDTRILLAADVTCEVIAEIVNMTRGKGNEERLKWDIYKLPHHCSYLSLAPSGEKGTTETTPIDEVQWLLEQGQTKGRIISTSEPIGTKDQTQPPHFQAKNAYRRRTLAIKGEFLVTMEQPSPEKPEPLVFVIDGGGITPERTSNSGATSLVTAGTPRVGRI